ncbi:MAG: NAD(P)/FAD-dependent oxidoreductase, partial [Candidatus Dormibacteria bacterium]
MASPAAATPQPAHREEADVCIVGAGPTGLTAAARLRQLGVERVVLVEREQVAGGIPRHSQHTGYGLGDMHRLLSGPRYAQRLVAMALRTGVALRVETSALDWNDDGSLVLAAPNGLSCLKARAVLLATGCRERPRTARLVPGTRPAGVFTTGQLQQWVYLNHWPVGSRAVVVGAEHVSFSALMTLRHAGVEPVAMVTEHPRPQTFAPLRWVTATARGVPVLTGRVVVAITGRTRVESIALRDVLTGDVQEIPCDTIVFTGEFVAESELARRGALALDTG